MVFVYQSNFCTSMRTELSTHSIATPVSANTASHMEAWLVRPSTMTSSLTRQREDNIFPGDNVRAACNLTEVGTEDRSAFMNTTSAASMAASAAAAHRRADIRACEYGRIIDAVADEHDRAVLLTDFIQCSQLILRQQACVHLVDADRLRDRIRARLTVTGQHGRAQTLRLHAADGLLRVRLYGIRDVDMTEEPAVERQQHFRAARRAVVAGKVNIAVLHELYVAAEHGFAPRAMQ